MNWKFQDNRPIYAQIVEEIQRRILSGAYAVGASLPSVRLLAVEANVNPNTMQKALAELENQGLLHTQRTSGRTVTTDERLIMDLKERIASGYIEQFFEGMKSLGIERDVATKMLMERKNGSVQEKATSVAVGVGTKEVG
ncbi:MAG TPA: GntR family transcriptional regulator [Coriobacteriia bacterium]|nr:GntR family transcriptional regulator [Coriobacteriia bacterium]